MGDPSRATILVVDDVADNLLILSQLLKAHYRVQVASSGAKALEIALGSHRPDMILLDVMMPGMDGYEVCSRLKAEPEAADIPVLFLTAKDDVEDETYGFALGCVDYIHKPISPPIVLARVGTHLEQHRLRKAERELKEKTLKGSLALVVEMMSMRDPEGFDWSRQYADLSERVAVALRMEEPWMVGLAALLSQIAAPTIPEAVMAKVRSHAILNTEEREILHRIPEIGHRLLSEIPHMEGTAEVIQYAQKNYNGSGFPADDRSEEDIPQASRILRITYDFMSRCAAKERPPAVVRDMLQFTSWYDPRILLVLKDLVDQDDLAGPSDAGDEGLREVAIRDLAVGQTLGMSLETREGKLLIRAGTMLTAAHLERLQNFARMGALPDAAWIQAP